LAVVALALAARAAYVVGFQLTGMQTGFNYLQEDVKSYEWMAVNLIEEGSLGYRGEPSARRGPGYPLFLAALYSIGGVNHQLARWVQISLDSLAAGLLLAMLRRLGAPIAGMCGGTLYALYPIFVYNSAELMTEALILPLSIGVLYAIIRACTGSRSHAWAFAAGLMVGAMYLVRENNILLPLPIALILWVSFRRRLAWGPAWASAVFLFGFLLLWSPWIVRNYVVFGELGIGGSTGGENLIRSMNMAVHGLEADRQWTTYRKEHGLVVYHEYHDPSRRGQVFPDEWNSDRETKRLAWEMIRAHPTDFVRFGLEKVGWMLVHADPYRLESKQSGLRVAVAWAYRVIAILGLIGAWVAWRRRYRVLLSVLATYSAAALLLLFLMTPFIRYRYVAVDLALVVLAGLAIEKAICRGAKPGRADTPAAGPCKGGSN